MKRRFCMIVLIALGTAISCPLIAQSQQRSQSLKLLQTIELPGVIGRIDHMAIDVTGKRLFVAALGNKTVEVVGLAAGRVIHTISGLKEPQGIFYVPESDLLFVADGQLGTCRIYKGSTYELVRSETALQDADNILIDIPHAAIYGAPLVEVGYGSGTASGLRALDSRNGNPLMEIPLGGHPEAFQVEGRATFINIPTAGYIAVVNTGRRRVVDKWPVQGFKDFFSMALDEANQRLFIGSRTPPALVVFDTKSGKMLTSVEAVGDADDLTYDAAHKRLYMSGGDGYIGIFEQRDPDHYALMAKMPSSPGARTSLFVPELNRFYVAAPSNKSQPARVLVYEVQP